MITNKTMLNFLREKFTEILVATLFVTFAGIWIYLGFPDQMREIVGGLFIAFLTVAGIRPRLPQPPTINAENVSAEYVDKASTETGDINAGEIKEKVSNESSNDSSEN